MHIRQARGENLRLYQKFELQANPRLNLILGPNAAGKTSLLEGLYLLGRAKSFRTSESAEILGPYGSSWSLFAEVENEDQVDRLGVGWNGSEQEQRLNGEKARTSALPKTLALQLIDPVGHRLVEEGPGYRRSYLDWGVFHVEPSFYAAWQRYQRCLRQRNQALRQNLPKAAISAWDEELSVSAEQVSESRRRHAEALGQHLGEWVETLLGISDTRVEFLQGWSTDIGYRKLLEDQLPQHRRLGGTTQGPHRAELKLWLAGQRAKGRVSRGQQKLLVAALVLAQCAILIAAGKPPPVILIDDFGAELSLAYQQRFVRALNDYPGQIFITAFELPAVLQKLPLSMFHVEHGSLTKVEYE
ncbi:MAG: replication and repair protein RecF [Hydrocarboniphaga sp.]|uniref:DNA replication/repair protein RecF n=1 Tax=Hydrocarboniphaga sp. TaxID=2033016 RepID=UPI0026129635|nr:DNA replication/repair protein RecF [Hydrocarboniphaga sp.]MDB5968238.1 replication and repair protein RecF [Hydrocarboniphaga sp.]